MSSETTGGISYAQAMWHLHQGRRVRLPHWNDESWMELMDGKEVMHLGGRITNCQPRDEELRSWEWRVCK